MDSLKHSFTQTLNTRIAQTQPLRRKCNYDDTVDVTQNDNGSQLNELRNYSSSKQTTSDPASNSLDNSISLDLQCLYSRVLLRSREPQQLHASLILKVDEIEGYRSSIDLICVIDASGSMKGDKIIHLKKSLITLLGVLTDEDRLCIILFTETADKLIPFTYMTTKNKQTVINKIHSINPYGGTSITHGIHMALREIIDREDSNNVTSIFLLSDGQDNQALFKIDQLVKSMNKYCFTIHTFGYGKDHDENLMAEVAKMKDGSYYYVQNTQLLDECFLDVLGGLVSIAAEQIEIDLSCYSLFKDLTISNIYGDGWQYVKEGHSYKNIIQQFAVGWRRSFVFVLSIPAITYLQEFQRNQKILMAKVTLTDSRTKLKITVQTYAKLHFYHENEVLPMTSCNNIVLVEFLRVKAAQELQSAYDQCMTQHFEEAQKILELCIVQISKHLKVLQDQSILNNLQICKSSCSKKHFKYFGGQQFKQCIEILQRQRGMYSQFGFYGQQHFECSLFQNNKQKELTVKLQQNKNLIY